MQRLYNIFLILTLLLGITSCSEEVVMPPAIEEYIPLEIPITRSNDVNEDRILNARIIVSKTTGSKEVLVNEYKLFPNISFTVEVPVGNLNLYLITNEKSSWNLNSVTSANQLKEKILDYQNAYPVVDENNPIPMLGLYENIHVNVAGEVTKNGGAVDLSSSSPGTVTRLFSKVTLNLNCLFNDLVSREPIELKSVSIKRMPKTSYLIPTFYDKGNGFYFDGANAPSSNFEDILSGSDVVGFKGKSEFYIPESLLTDTTYYSYISMKVNLPGGSTDTERDYHIVIGDGVAEPSKNNEYMLGPNKSLSDVRISRNKHYIFNIKIVSFSESSGQDLDIEVKVINWEETYVDPNNPGHQYNLNVSQSAFEFSGGSTPYTGVVNIDTDYSGGWSVTKTGGVTINSTSGDRLEFSAISSGTIKVVAGRFEREIKITVI